MSMWLALGVAAGAVSTHKPVLEALSTTGTRRRLVPALDNDGIGDLGEVGVPPPPGGWFDSDMVGACAVQRLRPDRWIMWYAGRSSNLIQSDVVPIATGAIGVATSNDGLVWERACGLGAAGECLGPRDGEAGFDASHVGVGDVTRVGDQLAMLYFGGGSELRDMGGGALFRGVGMCVGSATSSDGVSWTRQDAPLLQPTAGEQVFLGWPVRHGQHVYYHAAADSGEYGGRFVIGRARLLSPREAAISSDEIEDEGYVLTPGGAGAYDAGGVSARCVVAHPTDPLRLLMLYEALDETRSHAICLASSEDDGATWARIGQILRPSSDGWDSGAVSRPYLVPADPTDPTSRARLYYLGRSADGARQGIGVAESDDPEWREWTKL